MSLEEVQTTQLRNKLCQKRETYSLFCVNIYKLQSDLICLLQMAPRNLTLRTSFLYSYGYCGEWDASTQHGIWSP